MFNTLQLQQVFVSLAVLASVGTMVQETKLSRAIELTAPLSTLSISLPANLEGMHEAGAAHTHVEQPTLSQQFAVGNPRIQTRNDHRKYTLPKTVSRNNTTSGDSQISWPSI